MITNGELPLSTRKLIVILTIDCPNSCFFASRKLLIP
jgi:hypothetical protein